MAAAAAAAAAAGFLSLYTVRPAAVHAGGGGSIPDGRGRRSLVRRNGSVDGGRRRSSPSQPDYDAVDEGRPTAGEQKEEVPPRRLAAFTEEKARELRRTTMVTQGFHDAMYHSAIASRLASHPPPTL